MYAYNKSAKNREKLNLSFLVQIERVYNIKIFQRGRKQIISFFGSDLLRWLLRLLLSTGQTTWGSCRRLLRGLLGS